MAYHQMTWGQAVRDSSPWIDKLKNGVKGFGVTLKSVAINMLSFMAASFAIQAIATFIDDQIHAQEKLEEKANESITEYENLKSSISDINTELDENSKKINTLLGKDSLTYVEQSELDKLRETNNLLERQLELKQKEAKDKAYEVAENVGDTLKQYIGISKGNTVSDYLRHFQDGSYNENAIKDTNLGGQLAILTKYQSVLANTAKDTNEWQEANDKVAEAETNINNGLLDINQSLADMQEGYDSILDKVDSKGIESLTSQEQLIKATYEKYKGMYDNIFQNIDPKGYKASKIDKIFNKKDIEKTKKELVELAEAGELSNLDLSQYENLFSAMNDAGISAEELKNEISAMADDPVSAIKMNNEEIQKLSLSLTTVKENAEALVEVLDESISTSGLTSDSIDSITSMFSGLDGFDYAKLFENTANGVHLNTEELRKLQKEYDNTKKQKFDKELIELRKQYQDTCKEIANFNGTIGEKNELISKREALQSQIDTVEQLASQYDGLTSAYTKWETAQNGGEEGDTYDKVVNSLKDIKQLYKDGLVGTNEFRASVQLMSNEDLSAASVEELMKAYEKGYPKMQRYFQESSDGVLNFLHDAQKVNKEWVKLNKDGSWSINVSDKELAKKMGLNVETIQQMWRKLGDFGFNIRIDDSLDELYELREAADKALSGISDKEFKVNLDVKSEEDITKEIDKVKDKIEEINNSDLEPKVKTNEAEKYNDVLSYLQGSLGRITEAKYTIDIEADIDKLNEDVKKLKDNSIIDFDIDFNASDTQVIEDKINGVSDVLDKMHGDNETIDLKTKGAAEAQEVLIALLEKQYELKHPVLMDVDTSKLTGETQSAMKALQNLQDKYHSLDNLEAQKKVGLDVNADISKVKESITTAEKAFADNHPTMLGELHLDPESVSQLKSTIDSLSGDKIVNLGVNAEAINNYVPSEKTSNVKYNIDRTSVDAFLKQNLDRNAKVTASVSGIETVEKQINDLARNRTSTITVNTTQSGTSRAGGTPGSTYGNTEKDNAPALVGEVGREILVRDDRYFTIGEKSAEFFQYKKGDIIFSKKQSDELLSKGYVTSGGGRGRAFAEGNAFSNGTRPGNVAGTIYANGKKKTSASGSKKKSGSKKSSADDFLDTIDYIEIKIDRIERIIDKFALKTDSIYRTWTTRNSALVGQISEINNEINVQQQAYDAYIRKANSVGLSSSYANKIMNGSISIQDITDKDLSKKIKDFQEYYEKALDARDAIQELNEKVRELAKQKFDHIAKQFEDLLDAIESKKNFLESVIDTHELKGFVESERYYNELFLINSETLNELNKNKTALLSSLSESVNTGSIEKGSEAWYEMKKQIDEVQQSIYDAENTAQDLKNTIEEISWTKFDSLQDKISDIVDESEFLNDLFKNDKLFNDNGKFTNEGMSSMALYGVNYNTLMKQSDEYAKAIKELDKQYQNDSLNTRYLERRKELVDTQRDMIKNAEDEKESMKDLISDAYDQMLKRLDELIDKRKKLLSTTKDYYDYEKEIAEKTKNVTDIQKKISSFSGDTSEESKKSIQQLKVELQDAKDDLKESEYDRYISDQEALLDSLYDEAEQFISERLDNFDALLQDIVTNVNLNGETISNTIKETASEVGYTLSDSMSTIFSDNLSSNSNNIVNSVNNATNILSTYNNNFNSQMTSVLGAINNIGKVVDAQYQAAQAAAAKKTEEVKQNSNAVNNPSSGATSKPSNNSNSNNSSNGNSNTLGNLKSVFKYKKDNYPKSKLKRFSSIVDGLKYFDFDSSFKMRSSYYKQLGLGSSYSGTASQNTAMLKKFRQIMGYSKGGLVGNLKKVIGENGDDSLTINTLKRGESVFDPKTTEQLIKFNEKSGILEKVLDFTLDKSKTHGQQQCVMNFDNIELILPNVKDYESFKRQLMSDGEFTRSVVELTDAAFSGKNSLTRIKYRR